MSEVDLVLANGYLLGTATAATGAWLAIDGGRIVGWGDEGTTAPSARKIVDVGGRVVAPAFVDHHVHLLNVGMSLLSRESTPPHYLDLSVAGSIAELAKVVESRAAAVSPREWILGKGWSQGVWGSQQLPDRDALDRAAPEHPVYLTRVDAHAGWANGVALRRAGLDRGSSDPPGGELLRRASGELSGVLLERANEPLVAVLPPWSDDLIQRAFRRGAETLAAQGVTEVFDAGFLSPPGIVALNADFGRWLDDLLKSDLESPLPLRIWLMIPAPSKLAEEVLGSSERFRRLSPRIGVSHLKLFADGALGSRGARLSHPYSDDEYTSGVARMTEDEILSWSERAIDAGLDVATHAIGNAAVGATLDAYQRLVASRPGTDAGRLRIEHFSYAEPEDWRRAVGLGVILSVQPNFVFPDEDGRAMEDSRLGGRSEHAYPWGRLQGMGARLAGGSDYFTVPFPPLFSFHAAATRANMQALPRDGWHPQDRLSREDAWQLMTSSWPPGGGGPVRHRLAVGSRADLVILSEDPLQVASEKILEIRVHATLREGRATFRDDTLSELPGEH